MTFDWRKEGYSADPIIDLSRPEDCGEDDPPGFYFVDETWANFGGGPYRTYEEAVHALREYADSLTSGAGE